MKIIVTGSLGHISKPLTGILTAAGHDVTVISSDAGKVEAIGALGAKAAIGSIADVAFLTKTFTGADAIYTMVPPNFGASDYRQYIGDMGKNYAAAIRASGVARVVNLSSIGAHLDKGTGPIAGLHDVEETLNALDNVAVKHLRAGFFYVNFFTNIDMIKKNGILGSNYSQDARLVLVHPRDIAAAAASDLQGSFSGKSYYYVISDDQKIAAIVKALGTAIGKPDLPWVEFSDEDSLAGMTGAGLSPAVASVFVEMGTAIRNGILWEDYDKNKPATYGKTKLGDFAEEFAAVYKG
ncbi:NAD(P)H-binding protein [Chitinophaga filiformis]|uniref:NAD(P)H-binding protein n=1 Tax=Chitinophaga filiformis TaxID=104663 RepID=A0ABY4HYP7_CHIFI|nr:NAD(P)H-binding protein [Chitinophaga filiformis]UPK68702.1 NAD(P)H-binding protein [Chitinophaga filiformis]